MFPHRTRDGGARRFRLRLFHINRQGRSGVYYGRPVRLFSDQRLLFSGSRKKRAMVGTGAPLSLPLGTIHVFLDLHAHGRAVTITVYYEAAGRSFHLL